VTVFSNATHSMQNKVTYSCRVKIPDFEQRLWQQL